MVAISVERILRNAPERARLTYTSLLTHRDTRFDIYTGWSYAYVTQASLALDMGCSVATVQRAMADLRAVGVARVLAWPGAYSETHIRVSDISLDSPFGPVQKMLYSFSLQQLEERAVTQLLAYWSNFESGFPPPFGAAKTRENRMP